jgi:inosine/xanthosine triphosphatase
MKAISALIDRWWVDLRESTVIAAAPDEMARRGQRDVPRQNSRHHGVRRPARATDKSPAAVPADMRVGVGSSNPVKRAATEAAFASMAAVVVESVTVDSGVSEQPVGHAETIEGAETRACRALAAGSYDLGVGIEGGVARFDGVDGLFLVMWAAVTDGDTVARGAGPSLRLPEHVSAQLRNGEELGPVMDDAADREDVNEQEGTVGVLTGRIVERSDALTAAVAGALGPFVTDCY